MTITIYEVFELNRVLHLLMEQQFFYTIQTAFKIHELIKWLDDTESFVMERLMTVFGAENIDPENPFHKAFLLSPIPFVETTLKTIDLLDTTGNVQVKVEDVDILKKILDKTE